MSLAIRLKRMGGKSKPFFRVVVVDSRKKRDGRVLEYLGTYRPVESGYNFDVKVDKIEAWISKGAAMSNTVASFYRKAKKTTS